MFLITGGAGFIGSNVVATLEEWSAAPPIVCDRRNRRRFADLAGAVYRALRKDPAIEPAIEYMPIPEAIREKYRYITEGRLDRLRAVDFCRPDPYR